MAIRLIAALSLATTLNCFSQLLHADIKMVYDFSPAALSREEQTAKVPKMDEFWNKIKADTSKYLNELRNELQADGNPRFFYFDGGQLLLSISKSIKDKQVVLNAIVKSDLKDIDKRTFVLTLNYLAKSNLNTTEAALKILDDSEFKFFIEEHAFTFNQGYSLTYTLLPTLPDFYVGEVTKRFNVEKDINVKKSIVALLWFANSCSGNYLLKGLPMDKTIEKDVARYAKVLLTRKLKKEEYFEELDEMSFDELAKAQVASTNRMSDEATHELDYITELLRKKGCRQQRP